MNAANRDISRKRVPNGDHELECDARRLLHRLGGGEDKPKEGA